MRISCFSFTMVCFLLLSLTAVGQMNTRTRGVVLSRIDSTPVENALISIGDSLCFTNANGSFDISANFKDKEITIWHPGFDNLSTKILDSDYGRYFLTPNKELSEVNVIAKRNIGPYRGVIDMTFVEGYLLVSNFKGGKQWLEIRDYKDSLRVLTLIPDPYNISNFYTDCYGRVFGSNEINVFSIKVKELEPYFGVANKLEDFKILYNTCLIANKRNQLLGNLGGHNQEISIFGVVDTIPEAFLVYSSSAKEEFSYSSKVAKELKMLTGIFPNSDGTIKASVDLSKQAFDLLAFYRLLVKKKIYTPVFEVKGDWWLFDHGKGRLAIFNQNFVFQVDDLPIYYHIDENWSREIIKSTNGRLFLKFQNKYGLAYLREFDTEKKEPKESLIQLAKIFPEKILVSDTHIIYLAKDKNGYFSLFSQILPT